MSTMGYPIEEVFANHKMLLALLEQNSESFLALTRELEGHPEDYEQPCSCQSCMSYADPAPEVPND